MRSSEQPILAITTARQLGRVYMAAIQLRQQIRQSLKMTQTEVTVFEFMFMHYPAPVHAKDISSVCGISRSAITKLLNKLEAEQRITRKPAADDKRASDVDVAPEFMRELSEVDSALINGLMPVLSKLDPLEMAQLLRFLKDLADAAERLANTWR